MTLRYPPLLSRKSVMAEALLVLVDGSALAAPRCPPLSSRCRRYYSSVFVLLAVIHRTPCIMGYDQGAILGK